MAYYWNRPEQTAEAFPNGWLHTGRVAAVKQVCVIDAAMVEFGDTLFYMESA